MAILTSFTRPADPIEADGLGQKISSDIGTSVTAEMLADNTVSVTGSITETNRTAIQASINGYVYPNLSTRTVTSNYTVTRYDQMILANATSGAITITVPNGMGIVGKEVFVKKIDNSTNSVTISGTLDLGSSYTLRSTNKYVRLKMQGQDAVFYVVGNN